MSVFATLRRKRDRTKGAATHGTVLVAESKAEPLFNSTPNLHKINPGSNSLSLFKKGKESAVFYPEEDSDSFGADLEDEKDEKYVGFGGRRSSSAAETARNSGQSTQSSGSGRLYSKHKGSASGSLRHFSSMISMFGSLKRTKSSRKMSFGSTQVADADKREGTEYMRTRAAGKSPDPEFSVSKSGTLISKNSQSIDCLCEGAEGEENLGSNTEPGVRSSSSSDDDDSRRSSVTDSFKKLTNLAKNEAEQDSDYTTTKTEEELKRTKIMIQGIKKFNMDPKKGIEFLVENDILQHTRDDVAKFLKFGEGLSKTAIGNYLGEHKDFNEDVLQSFLDLHNFKDLILVQALRDFLWSFRLPGESQKIDRMMEAFAKRYCQSNPGIFSCTDTCYLLSYSIIMLNTTLHNPSVKDKPSLEQFIQMNRDVDCGKSLNRSFLVHQYNSILTEPFKIPPEDANDLVLTFFNPNLEGRLWKQGAYKTWKRRWFILSNNCLYYFKFTTDKSPRGIVPLENVNAREIPTSKSNELFPFILYKKSTSSMPSDVIKTCKTLSNGTTVLSQSHTITLASINQEERKKWIQSINQNNSNSDFYDVLTIKKRNLEASRQQQSKGNKKVTTHSSGTPKRQIRKSLISQPSTAPGFEYKEKLPPELIAPAGPLKDPNSYFKNYTVFSSSASISSGSAIMESDSSYGSFTDISRSRSESRILDDTSESSTNLHNDTIDSVAGLELDDSLTDVSTSVDKNSIQSDSQSPDSKYSYQKKLSIIEESQNHSDRSSNSSGANNVDEDISNITSIEYRKLSENDISTKRGDAASSITGAHSSDKTNCDTTSRRTLEQTQLRVKGDVPGNNRDAQILLLVPDELSNRVQMRDESDIIISTVMYNRAQSMESDV